MKAKEVIRTVETIERYGRQGLIVSIIYGPSDGFGDIYSVSVFDKSSDREFEKPFGASCFEDIAMILDAEIPKFLAGENLRN